MKANELAQVLELSEAMATVHDQDALLAQLVEKLKPLFDFEDCGIFVVSADGQFHRGLTAVMPEICGSAWSRFLAAHNAPQLVHLKSALEYMMGELAAHGSPRLFRFPALCRQFPLFPQFQFEDIAAYGDCLAAELRSRDQVIGMLCLNAQKKNHFRLEQFHLLQAVADQVVVAVASILANEETLARERETATLLGISRALATIQDRKTLFATIIEQAQSVMPVADTGIVVLDATGKQWKDWTNADNYQETSAINQFQQQGLDDWQPMDPFIAHSLLHTGITSVAQFMTQCPEHPFGPIMWEAGLREMMHTPLVTGGRTLGVLFFDAEQEGTYTQKHLSLFQGIADQVAVAVANILANEELVAHAREKDLQLAVNNALVSSKDRENLCLALAGQMNQLVPFSFFVLCTWDEADAAEYQLMLRRQPDGNFVSVRREVVQIAPPKLTRKERDELFECPGVYAGPDYDALCDRYQLYRFVREQFGFHSQLRLSIHSRTGIRTSIVVSGHGAHDFRPVDYAKLQHLVPQITLALDNLLAFENLDQQRREKSVEVAVTNLLTSPLSFDKLMPALASQLDTIMRCDIVHLCLLPPRTVSEADVAMVREDGQFRRLTLKEVQPWLAAEELTTSCAKLQELAGMPRLYIGDELPTTTNTVPLLHYLYEHQSIRSLLLLPLRVGDEQVGTLLLGHRFAYAFTDRDRDSFQTIAAQMALALGHRLAFSEIATLQQQLAYEKNYLQDEIKTTHNFEEIIGSSPALLEVFQQVSQVAGTNTTVCIGGETGTGKELIARALHNLSPRQDRLLVKVNCAALPAQLIESELFGHEKGSFTGAFERRIGKFELADGGSIFLDEIGEMPLELQAKLLRVLQEKEIERIGGKGTIRTDVRIIAATNRDLAQEVQAGRFRQDLYFRLMVFPIQMPPLRERKEDIPGLINHFLFQFDRKIGKSHKGLSPTALRELMEYDWPGNIRELQHLLEQAVIVSTKPLLELARPLRATPTKPLASNSTDVFAPQSINDLERQHIVATLRHTNGRIRGPGGAAELLQIKATTLEARMKKLGIGKNYA